MKAHPWLVLTLSGCLGAAAHQMLHAQSTDANKPVAAKADSAAPAADGDKPGVVSAVVGGREVSVTAPDTTATINVVGPRAEVKAGPQLIVVEKNQIVVDGKALGEIPPDTRKVEITVAKGAVSVKADGKEVGKTPIGTGSDAELR